MLVLSVLTLPLPSSPPPGKDPGIAAPAPEPPDPEAPEIKGAGDPSRFPDPPNAAMGRLDGGE